jgi:hypothetical protein
MPAKYGYLFLPVQYIAFVYTCMYRDNICTIVVEKLLILY